MAGLSLVTPPAIEPITLTEAKLYCKIDVTDDDTLVTDLIVGARRVCEERRGWSFITQTWDYFLDNFPPHGTYRDEWISQSDQPIILPRSPVQSITTLKYTPYNASIVTVSSADYALDATNLRAPRLIPVIGKVWPADTLKVVNGVEVRMVTGYGGTAASVPEHLRLAMKQLVNMWYYQRDLLGTIPAAIDELLSETPSGFAYA